MDNVMPTEFDIQSFLSETKKGIQELVAAEWKDYSDEALSDGKAFLEDAKDDFKRWAQLRVEGKLSNADVIWLVKGKQDVAKLQALKQAGVSLVRLEGFAKSLIDIVLKTAIDRLENLPSDDAISA